MAEYSQILNQDGITFSAAFKLLPTEGNLAWEYNPFRNYRIQSDKYEYKGQLYTLEELKSEFNIVPYSGSSDKPVEWAKGQNAVGWATIQTIEESTILTPFTEDVPILKYSSGSLIDFETDQLSFDISHPVDILPQYSYDGSVNLILNDGTNQPRLINSRFSPIGRNKYQIVDRAGDNDTNIYDEGEQFDIDTSLYKRTISIPELKFTGVTFPGILPVGNYHFYFKYQDADGNETDFIAESGLVSMFVGKEPYNIHTGFRDQNSNKGCNFILSNLDPAYQYISVYYTRVAADIRQNPVTTAYKINQKYLINNAQICGVTITGYEDTSEISLEDINLNYQIVQDAFTQATCQNMLFLGNVHKPDIPYTELQDISLRITAELETEEYNQIGINYNESCSDTYYDPNYIYSNVGYWPDEIYRFGIVYILSDNTLSPVFNIRGGVLNSSNNYWTQFEFYQKDNNKVRNYISYDEETFLISQQGSIEGQPNISLENAKGVYKFPKEDKASNDDTNLKIYSIKFSSQNLEESKEMLSKLGIKGYFFVRQKRMPLTLCQALTIGVDKQSHLPAIKSPSNLQSNGEVINNTNTRYIIEQLLDNDQILDDKFHPYLLNEGDLSAAAICPDYDINPEYYNQLFNGDNYSIAQVYSGSIEQDSVHERHFIVSNKIEPQGQIDVPIIGIEDNVKLVGIRDFMYAARAGEAEEGFRYEYIGYENKVTKATNIARGSYGPYLGLGKDKVIFSNSIVNIKIPNYNEGSMSEYFTIRYNDKSSYYAIGDRYSINNFLNDETAYYRGDCYICQFTHRINRNFSDPSAPTNDQIVDKNTWKDKYEVKDGVVLTENFDEINLGDLNAKQLGMWVTFTVRSNYNLSVRSIDESIPDEVALYGHPRTFYPFNDMSTKGVYKIPEATCYNKAFSVGLSERYNFEVPDVPYIKNEFTNRILYSDIQISDAYINGFRTFRGTHYRDYTKSYGAITKLVEFRDSLICVFEHGIALIPVNERAVAGEGQGGLAYINTSNVLPENPKIISDKFGSQWRESIIKTPFAVYGVDTVGKKIWRTDGTQLDLISDLNVQEFLNHNITLTEREIDPIIGIRNVKTHYNAFKHDVMFTFYDNLYGYEEKAWNLCYNEILNKWITFYSWMPSYSENIYNQYYSFDRNTSKWIAKLGISKKNSDFADGIVVDNNIIPISEKDAKENPKNANWETNLSLVNRNIPDQYCKYTYTIEHDNFGNYKWFTIDNIDIEDETDKITGSKNILKIGQKTIDGTETFVPIGCKEFWDQFHSEFYDRNTDGTIREDSETKRLVRLENPINPDKVVIYLNISVQITLIDDAPADLKEALETGIANQTLTDAAQYQSTIALILDWNQQFLTTDFWKHGQAGIINIADNILPTRWYDKQHPFEFEFIVNQEPDKHKIFDNLQIISNNAEPESFHYEIVGDVYDFAVDKKNMYIRQEATKELFQYNGYDVVFDHDYTDLVSVHRPLNYTINNQKFEKSTLFPLYYYKQDTVNDIEDKYSLANTDYFNWQDTGEKNIDRLAGGEIVRYKTLNEYRIVNHCKAVDIKKTNRLRGNMMYKEDRWDIVINPINYIQCNEPDWSKCETDSKEASSDKIPVELGKVNVPLDKNTLEVPSDFNRGITTWNWQPNSNKEVKIKDKWIKIRVRYTGDKLAVISALKTLYTESYS